MDERCVHSFHVSIFFKLQILHPFPIELPKSADRWAFVMDISISVEIQASIRTQDIQHMERIEGHYWIYDRRRREFRFQTVHYKLKQRILFAE